MRQRTESSDSMTDIVKERTKKGAQLLVRTYQWAFNAICLLAWTVVFLLLACCMLARKPLPQLYHAIILPLLVAQNLAVMEPLHTLLGITKNRYLPVLMQVSSRLWMTWVIVLWCNTGAHLCFPLMVMAWYYPDAFSHI
jgi:hypothetical protein